MTSLEWTILCGAAVVFVGQLFVQWNTGRAAVELEKIRKLLETTGSSGDGN